MSRASSTTVVPLLVFEAADCLMAVIASEVSHLEKRGREGFPPIAGSGPIFDSEAAAIPFFDLDRYFIEREADGPWLQWTRGTRRAWIRVRRVIDVVPTSLAALTPMPALLRAKQRTRAFLAAGVRDNEVFLLLDPARLAP
jgi:hypothetical protein